MTNILHIINGWPPGGITEQVYLLCKYLPKNQFRQYSAGYCHFDGPFFKKFEDVGTECISCDEDYSNIRNIILDKKIDIVHKQTGGGDFPSYVSVLKDMGIPLIESIHCPRATGIPIALVDKIVYTTRYTLEKNNHKYFDKMISIKYALDLEEPVVNHFSKKDSDNIIVGRLGRIVPDKRSDVVLEVAKMSYERFGNKIQFHLAGQIPQDYPMHIDYGKRFIEACEELPNVKYMGYVDNKYDFWKTLDICINPAWETSFDIVFLEAMACGVPILTWDNSAAKYVVGNAGIVTEENTGFLFDGLCKMYREYGMRKLMGEIGIRYINDKYSLKRCINEYIDLYEGIA